MKDKNHVEEKIIKTLREHPEGLPILEIAKIIGSHRHTVTKYIYHLIGDGTIYEREIGPARLCHISSKLIESAREREIFEKIEKGVKK
jgi:hypothetical protein